LDLLYKGLLEYSTGELSAKCSLALVADMLKKMLKFG